jgi:hypothetical protein
MFALCFTSASLQFLHFFLFVFLTFLVRFAASDAMEARETHKNQNPAAR